jgi:protein-tyrosine phosphatase
MLNYIDIHAHILPGLDDGPSDWSESIALCKALVADGVKQVIATPHQLGRFGNTDCMGIRRLVHALNDRLKIRSIPLTVYPGAEVRLDERIESLLNEDKVLTLADGRNYLLLELLPDVSVPLGPFIKRLIDSGLTPIIAHAERYPYFIDQPERAFELTASGAVFQVTASSLVGQWGRSIQTLGWHFLHSGAVVVVASDAHDTDGRAPRMRQAFEMIQKNLTFELACLLCHENPENILTGKPLIRLPALTHEIKNVRM